MKMGISLYKASKDSIQILSVIVKVGPFQCKTQTWEAFSACIAVNRTEIDSIWLNLQKVITT